MNHPEFRQIRTPRGFEGIYGWFLGDVRLCDHEHDEFDDRMCEDAQIEAARLNITR